MKADTRELVEVLKQIRLQAKDVMEWDEQKAGCSLSIDMKWLYKLCDGAIRNAEAGTRDKIPDCPEGWIACGPCDKHYDHWRNYLASIPQIPAKPATETTGEPGSEMPLHHPFCNFWDGPIGGPGCICTGKYAPAVPSATAGTDGERFGGPAKG